MATATGQSPGRRRPALRLRAEAGALPFRRGALRRAEIEFETGMVAAGRLPLVLAELHRCLPVGGRLDVVLPAGKAGDSVPPSVGERLDAVLTGAGFDLSAVRAQSQAAGIVCRRARTLPDTVAPGMRVLVCGLNPSLYAADAGTAFARPGNRFWPAALAAGLVSVDRDPWHALRHHRVGMTDLVKRATVAAGELTSDEYRRGVARVERLCAELRPAVVCFVGLAGWRAAVDRAAPAGPQPGTLGGRPVYLMPSTSGRNASARLDELTSHLRAALTLAEPAGDG
ncbi:MAG TPA: mismatch-specific DNA-glycosylase [Acidimicrobiales bacterium]|nr:mismatch-specific DNA-glycosylase [Acidimicrobiales bacterium]